MRYGPSRSKANSARYGRRPRRRAGRRDADGNDKVRIGDNNSEYAYFPARTRVKAGTTVTFTNAGDIPHTATAFDKGKIGDWDTGALSKGDSKEITFKEPGTYFYICTPHPWMYGQVIVE